ncbi:MAG: hypothetical protein IJ237_07715 [Oscillospiraceae bacterium]|nr:hypothetical protein [Oscillospiraceae bacterium]
MKKEWMDKPILCIFDTRQIQAFMFRANSYYDTLGGSDLMVHILVDAIYSSLKTIDPPLADDEFDLSLDPDGEIPYFSSERIKFQLIMCAAGNAICLVRTGALAQKIIRKCSRYYLDHAYSLNLDVAVTEMTGDFGRDISNLFNRLDAIKASGDISNPLGPLSCAMRENRTGEPVVGIDPVHGDYVSRSSILRRKEATGRGTVIGMDDILTTRAANGKDYLAVLHADGNNLGITIGRIMRQTSSYEESIRARRRIDWNIKGSYCRIMKATLRELEAYYYNNRTDDTDFAHAFQVIHQAGDDLNILCSASLVIPFLDIFYRNLDGSLLFDEGGVQIPLYVCTGVAFVTKEKSFASAFALAEQCCASAKKEAKKEINLRDGLAGNWIDYQISDYSSSQELELLRRKAFVSRDGISLLLRPYCLDRIAAGEKYAYDALKQRIGALHQLELADEMRNILRESYMLGRTEFEQWIAVFARQGTDLKKVLGEPLYRDRDGNQHAVWYDALTLMDFFRKEGN